LDSLCRDAALSRLLLKNSTLLWRSLLFPFVIIFSNSYFVSRRFPHLNSVLLLCWQNLYARMQRMKESINPLFSDVTWGAGGSSADLTQEISAHLKNVSVWRRDCRWQCFGYFSLTRLAHYFFWQ
jgi:hypothetical protein